MLLPAMGRLVRPPKAQRVIGLRDDILGLTVSLSTMHGIPLMHALGESVSVSTRYTETLLLAAIDRLVCPPKYTCVLCQGVRHLLLFPIETIQSLLRVSTETLMLGALGRLVRPPEAK